MGGTVLDLRQTPVARFLLIWSKLLDEWSNRNFGGVDGSWRIGSEKVEVKSEKQEKRPVFCFFLTPHSSLLTFPFALLTLCRRSCANRDPEQRHLGVQLICEASSLFQRWHIHGAYPEDAPS